MERRDALLVLEDGSVWTGKAMGRLGEAFGEIVFNTSMTGYQEILTDPSYKGQMVVMTYPLIGNYGTNLEDPESRGAFLEGFVVRELSACTSNCRARSSLEDLLLAQGVVGITEVDTRAVVRHIREGGSLRAVISSLDLNVASLLEKVRSSPRLDGRDLVAEVTRGTHVVWREGYASRFTAELRNVGGARRRVVAFDFGIKSNILRSLVQMGFEVLVVPAHTKAREVDALRPDGVFLSNGPGDPEPITYAIATIRELMPRYPVFGICLGHQLVSLALGGRTFKMKFGHHGGNQPVIDLGTGKTEITAQNHSFAVDPESLDPELVEITHVNLNDKTVEGLRHRHLPVFTVQYHPEAAPGPHDALYLFERFARLIEERQPARLA
ncbi:MAG: glutamine-hydrolyzing carbamoyl-phosphate synthase small subunit [Planctomycetota bacterium]